MRKVALLLCLATFSQAQISSARPEETSGAVLREFRSIAVEVNRSPKGTTVRTSLGPGSFIAEVGLNGEPSLKWEVPGCSELALVADGQAIPLAPGALGVVQVDEGGLGMLAGAKKASYRACSEEGPIGKKQASDLAAKVTQAQRCPGWYVDTEEDRFTGTTGWQTRQDFSALVEGELIAQLISVSSAQGMASLVVRRSSPTWRYLECPLLNMLVDGRPFKPTMEPVHDGSVTNSGVLESLTVHLTEKELAKLASASRIELRACGDEFEPPPDFVRCAVPEFYALVSKGAK